MLIFLWNPICQIEYPVFFFFLFKLYCIRIIAAVEIGSFYPAVIHKAHAIISAFIFYLLIFQVLYLFSVSIIQNRGNGIDALELNIITYVVSVLITSFV